MPEIDKEGKNYYTDVPQKGEMFFLKGCNELDWGMKNRLARIFNPKDGRTVMLAIDHGYFQGPTTGLERIDVTVLPLVPYSDTLMCTRGVLRSHGAPVPRKARRDTGVGRTEHPEGASPTKSSQWTWRTASDLVSAQQPSRYSSEGSSSRDPLST